MQYCLIIEVKVTEKALTLAFFPQLSDLKDWNLIENPNLTTLGLTRNDCSPLSLYSSQRFLIIW